MKIITTFGELQDKGVWEQACEMLGLNEWCINEGLALSDDEITLTEEQGKKLGLLKTEE